MLELHLYGKLRRYADRSDPTSESIRREAFFEGDTLGSVIDRIGIPANDLGSNMFVNGRYADRSSALRDGDRIGLFPDDMQLLYKWYFAPQTPAGASSLGSMAPRASEEAPNQESARPSEKGGK
jgi:hypothetical protein